MMKTKNLSTLIIFSIFNILLSTVCAEKLVIDTDGGADDAAAILLALSAWANNDSDHEIVAITCVNGNVDQKTVQKNVLKTLTIANASDITVYGGAVKPLLENSTLDYYFGNDGLGDFYFGDKISAKVDASTHASVALIQLAKLHARELSVLCLGPLTNIALAAALDPSFMQNVKRFYIVGGSVSGIGNKKPGIEFNFAGDPESNFIVLNYTLREPSLLYPWEAALNTEIPKIWRTNKLGSINSKTMKFLNKAESKSLRDGSDFWTLVDIMATAVMIWPQLLKESVTTNVTPITDGAARGSVIVDYTQISGKPKNVEIVQVIDVQQFKRKLIYHFS